MIPILIGGTGRSGTTVLRRVLGAHPRVVSVRRELRIIVDPGGALDLARALSEEEWSPYGADAALWRFRDMLGSVTRANLPLHAAAKALRLAGVTPPRYTNVAAASWFGRKYFRARSRRLLADLVVDTSPGSWIGSPPWRRGVIHEAGPFAGDEAFRILERYFHDLFRSRGQRDETHWVEDTPGNLLRPTELFRLFPEARLIHIHRHPLDVLASYRRFGWGGEEPHLIARRLSAIYQCWQGVRSGLPDERYLEISLERFARDPEQELERLCDFAGLPVHTGLADLELGEVHSGRWARDLTTEEAERAASVLGPYIEELGYTLDREEPLPRPEVG